MRNVTCLMCSLVAEYARREGKRQDNVNETCECLQWLPRLSAGYCRMCMLSTEYKPTIDEIYQNAAVGEGHRSQRWTIQWPKTALALDALVQELMFEGPCKVRTIAVSTGDQDCRPATHECW